MKNLPVIAGVEIATDDQGRFNLNALHKASGGQGHKKPSQWLRRQEAKSLITELGVNLHPAQEVVSSVNGGLNAGTFAHELLAVSYAGWISPAFQLKVNQVFLDFRAGRLQPPQFDPSKALSDPATMRSLLLGYTEKVLELEDQVKTIQPKADALDRIATGSQGSMCITDTAKHLQVKPRELFGYLSAQRWIYRRLGTSWIAYQDKLQSGLLEHKVTEVTRDDGSLKLTSQVRVTAKGIARLSKVFHPVI